MGKPSPFQNSIIVMPDEPPVEKGSPSRTAEDAFHESILARLEPTEPSKREDTIIQVNANQDQQLANNGVSLIHGNSEHAYHRKLVAYYRPTQIDYVSRMQVLEIMRFLRYYVEQGYSSLFDEFIVLYRFPDTDMVEEFARNSYDVTGLEFQTLSSIYANMIHFSNGTPDLAPGTIPILGTTPYNRWKQHKDKVVHFPIEYETVEKIGHKHGIVSPVEIKEWEELHNPKKLVPVLNIALDTIRRTEAAMIQTLQ